MIDTNVYLSRWPFRRLPGDDTAGLVSKLKAVGVTQAWAGSFDALLHRDTGGVNLRLKQECSRLGAGLLEPVGTVNPAQPDWEEDLRRCQERYSMKAIRLHPNYHGYGLDGAAVKQLLFEAARRKLLVQVAVQMEDERTQHPLLRVAPVSLKPLAAALRAAKGVRVQILNHMRLAPEELKELAAAGDVCFDFAMVEGVHGLARLMKTIPVERIAFGSYYPFFLIESALGKVKEASATEQQMRSIFTATAQRLSGDGK